MDDFSKGNDYGFPVFGNIKKSSKRGHSDITIKLFFLKKTKTKINSECIGIFVLMKSGQSVYGTLARKVPPGSLIKWRTLVFDLSGIADLGAQIGNRFLKVVQMCPMWWYGRWRCVPGQIRLDSVHFAMSAIQHQ